MLLFYWLIKSLYIIPYNTQYGHAEVNCIKKINKKKSFKGEINIIVIRSNGTNLLNSKPCIHCINYIKKYNISNIYYSIENNIIIKEKIYNIETNHVSKNHHN